MTFKHKLSRRLALLLDDARRREAAARAGLPVLVAALVAVAGCQSDRGLAGPDAGDATRIVISPRSITIGINRTVDFSAVALSATDDTLSGPVVWNVTGGSLDETSNNNGRHRGRFRAGADTGKHKVIVRRPREGVSDTADVTVSPVTVTTVTVSPASATVAVGQRVRFSATVRDSAGNTLTDRAVAWTSSAPAVATVAANGEVTGVTPGSATITATSEGRSGTASVTVPVPPPPSHTGHYVAPGGSSGGTGAADRPWDLATALAGAGGRVQPGDTVWLRGGVYRGAFFTNLNASASARIVFRQYPGERATIDGTLRAEGSYLTFWGFEIMQSNPLASSEYVLRAYTREGRFVNLVLHDAGVSGISFAKNGGEGVELYGSLVFNNGTHENIDHGIYAHNQTTGTKYITDNVFFNNYARGIQIYADEDVALRNIHVVGNISFNNGTISSSSTRVNLLISARVPTSGMIARDNLLFASAGAGGINIRLGNYGAVYNQSIEFRNNYAAGGAVGLQMVHPWDQATVDGNVLIGSTEVVQTGGAGLGSRYAWRNNVYHRDAATTAWEHDARRYSFGDWRTQSGLGGADQTAATPSAPRVFVRPNRYEAGRAHVGIYNWGRQASVAVDLAGVLRAGDRYEIRNVQDYYGAPVVSGTYDGSPVSVPMTGVEPPAPVGRTAPNRAPRTGPDFDVFVVVRVNP